MFVNRKKKLRHFALSSLRSFVREVPIYEHPPVQSIKTAIPRLPVVSHNLYGFYNNIQDINISDPIKGREGGHRSRGI